MQYYPQHRQVALLWIRSSEWWAKDTVLPGLKLLFKNVSFFQVKERDADYPLTEDDCLIGVSFHPVAAREDFDSVFVAFAPTDDLTLFFQSEWDVKVNAESAELTPLPGGGG